MPREEDIEPKQLRILKALTAHVAGIHPDQDDCEGVFYEFDLRNRVYRGRSVITAEDAEDAVSILESPQNYEPAETESAVGKGQMLLLIQGWPKDNKANPSDPAYRLMAEVAQRISMITQTKPAGRNGGLYPVYRLGGEITSMKIGQGVVRPPEDQLSRLAMFFIPVKIEFKQDHTDPWA